MSPTPEPTPDVVDYLAQVQQLRGQPCWAVVAGPPTGSVFNLHLGPKIPRARPLTNPHIAPELRANSSRYGLLVGCDWRLEDATDVVCSSHDDNAPGGPMTHGLALLIGSTVTGVTVQGRTLDLQIDFSNQMTLALFCDTRPDDLHDYVVFVPGASYSIGPHRQLVREAAQT